MIVRRLTLIECERLQGFPDNWTLIGKCTMTKTWKDEDGNEYPVKVYKYKDENGKLQECSDSKRYTALGNSIALPYWKVLMKNISAQYDRPATLGSLFDGIGGFPFIWAQINGLESVRWSSEIEPYCVAVLRQHFGDEDKGIEGDFYDVLKAETRRKMNKSLPSQQYRTFDVRISTDGTKNYRGHAYETTISRSLDSAGEQPDSNHGGVCIISEEYKKCDDDVYALDMGGGKHSCDILKNVAPTLATTHYGAPAAFIKEKENEE